MKKIVLLWVALIFTGYLASSQIAVAPMLGINSSRFGGDVPETRFYNHVRAGLLLQSSFDPVYALQTGIQYSGKGTRLHFSDSDRDAYRLAYIEVPVHMVVNAELELGSLQFFLGPYLGYCIGGEYKYLSDENDRTRKLEIGTSRNDEIKPLDFGLNVGAGYIFYDFQVQVGYGGSMVNISNLENEILRNNTIFITLAYFINPAAE